MVPGHSKPHSDTADIGGSNPNNGHQALSSQPPRWLSSRSRRQSNVTSVPPTTRMTTGRFARWIPSQVTDHLPALPSASSIPYFTDGMLPNWRRVATGSGNDPELAEPFEEVLPCSSSDDSTGTTVHERVDHFSDGNACELRHYRRDEDSFFLVHNAEEISADDKYDPRKWLDRPQTQTQRAARILGEGARAARQTAVRVGETAVVAGEMAMEVARVGAEVARVGAQIGGAIMVANGYNPMFDLVRDTRVWSTRSGLEFQDEAQPERGGFDGDDSEEYESSDEEDSEDSDKDEIITDGLQLSGQERASNNDSSTDIRFFDAPEQPIASVGHIPIRHANDAFSDVELDSSGSEDRKEDFEDISIDECRAAFYALEDLGPHTRRRLQASQPVRRGLFTPNIMFGRNAPRRVPPSPSSSSVALVSERPDELPRSKRPGRHH